MAHGLGSRPNRLLVSSAGVGGMWAIGLIGPFLDTSTVRRNRSKQKHRAERETEAIGNTRRSCSSSARGEGERAARE